MKRGNLIYGLLLMMPALTMSCTKAPTLVDNFYGTSYELAKQSQLYDPGAGGQVQPIEGVEGTVAKRIIDRYEQGFGKPAPKTESYSVTFEGMTKK